MTPSDSTAADPLTAVLSELAAVLADERRALRTLDHRAIALTAERKLDLDARLRTLLVERVASAEHRAALERVSAEARLNHLLLSHARSCVTGILNLLRGAPRAGYQAPGQVAATPLRLDFRG